MLAPHAHARPTLDLPLGTPARPVARLLRRLGWAADWRSLLHMYRPEPTGVTRFDAKLRGERYPVHVRTALGELEQAERTFCEDSDWRLPLELAPRTILDIGAGIGLSTMYFAARYPWSRVVAFEPRADRLALLRANTAAFGERVTIIPRALAHRRGWLRLAADHAADHDYASDDTGNTLPFDGPLGAGGGPRVQATTLRRALPGLRLDAVDVVKIDAPGHEAAILRGTPPDVLAQVRVLITHAAAQTHDLADLRHALDATHALTTTDADRLIATRRHTPLPPRSAATQDLALRHAA